MDSCLIAVTLTGFLSGLGWLGMALLGLGFVIFVHELGHFLVAKACGVKCDKFYIGFDVPIKIGPWKIQHLGKFQWGETEYGIGIIPLGGYVKMLGQDDNPGNAEEEAKRTMVANEAGQLVLDPRSYRAKSVPQRMAIISAGVIMNVIFAVILAACAYRSGVSITPTEIGGTVPGDPAWVAGLEPGDKILQIGKSGQPHENLRYDWDMRQVVMEKGLESDHPELDFLVRRNNGSEEWITIKPTDRLVKLKISPAVTIGVHNTSSTTLDEKKPTADGTPAEGKFQPSDRIIAVDGRELNRSNANDLGDFPDYELDEYLARHLADPVTFTVERRSKSGSVERVDVTVPPNPLKLTGIVMEIGPVVGMRLGSPATLAGFQVGDILKKVNGEPIGDPVTLPQRILKLGDKLTFEVERADGDTKKTVELTVKPAGRVEMVPANLPGQALALDTVGIAYTVDNVVQAVSPDVAAAGLQPGDEITSVQLHAVKADVDKKARTKFLNYDKPIELDAAPSWPVVHGVAQRLLPEMDLRVAYKRGKKLETVTIKPTVSDEFFNPDRGLNPRPLTRMHQADSWSTAFQLGLRETKENLIKVVRFLKMLVGGRVPLKYVGGPFGILEMASSEASHGVSRLLLFLTMLSANLAILNFLPIPVLDGGHMLFLTYEAIRGRPVNERVQFTLTMAGFVSLLALILFATYNDVLRWL